MQVRSTVGGRGVRAAVMLGVWGHRRRICCINVCGVFFIGQKLENSLLAGKK